MKSKGLKVLSLVALTAALFACGSSKTSSSNSTSSASSQEPTSEVTTSNTTTSEVGPTTSDATTSVVAPTTSETTTSEAPAETILTIAEVQATAANTTVITKGVVVATTQKSLLLSDGTAKIVIWLNNTPKNVVGDYLKVSGKLVARNGKVQFDKTCTITKIDETKPSIEETAVSWTLTDVDAYIAKTEAERQLGLYVNITGQLRISGGHYNVNLGSETHQLSLTSPLASFNLTSGKNYTFTGYVLDVSSDNDNRFVNYYVTGVENAAYDKVTDLTLSETEVNLTVGDTKTIDTTVSPATANQEVTWSSSVESVATVENGVITAVAAGNTVITVTTVDKTAEDVAVSKTINVTVASSEITLASEKINTFGNKGTLEGKTITFTGTNFKLVAEQNKSNTAIRTTDTDHFRLYQDFKVTISSLGETAKNIKKIELNTTAASYADASFISMVTEGADVIANGTTITISFLDSALAQTVEFTLAKQVRITGFTTYYAA